MRVEVHLGGQTWSIGGGELVGRAATAAVQIAHDHVSEAHAFVSPREGGLVLQALRGPLFVGDAQVAEVVLEPGVVVRLAPGVELRVGAIEGDEPEAPVAPTVPWAESLAFRVTLEGVELSGPDGDVRVWVKGRLGLLLAELLRLDEPVSWARLARRVWPREKDEDPELWKMRARKRLDMSLARLRDRLKELGVRRPLVQVGGGQVGLSLRQSDRVAFED
ncbi:MAG: hypothetical protein H6737_20070 [Alphaproteobacteria bacterium]|nr:hypothetical protein [Alphaproteobacteria bacterium]